MQFDATTFILEILNLLVLVWLLKRFLYRPILEMIERRRQDIQKKMADAELRQQQTDQLRQQYEQRLDEWEEEKRQTREAFQQTMEQERVKRLQQLNEELDQQRSKRLSQDQQQQTQWRTEAEEQALQQAAVFTSRLLGALSTPELDLRLQQLFLQQLKQLPDNMIQRWQESWEEQPVAVEVLSAQPLSETTQQQIRQALEQCAAQLRQAQWQYHHAPELIAGLRVVIGGWILRASLQDELRFFAEAANG